MLRTPSKSGEYLSLHARQPTLVAQATAALPQPKQLLLATQQMPKLTTGLQESLCAAACLSAARLC
jgi:hypothetical protein